MRKFILITTAAFLATAFVPKKKKEFIPPGAVKISDTLYADETEITNLSWQVYTSALKEIYGTNSTQYISALPDTTVWQRSSNNLVEHYTTLYRRHLIYHDYPVVGITYEQAIEYCKWRTQAVKRSNSSKYPEIELEYRLPSKQEWELMASNAGEVYMKKNYAVYRKIDKDHEECSLKYNACCKVECLNDSNDICNLFVTRRVKSFKPNPYRMYDMIGNVSEMVLEKGISKGGSWKHTLEECRVGKEIPYEKPTSWLGFRCVCVVKRTVNS